MSSPSKETNDSKTPDPVMQKFLNLTSRQLIEFHRNDDVDSKAESHHHTLGTGRNQASDGRHTHDGVTSQPLLNASISGSRASNLASIVNQLLTELEKIGLINATTA